MPLPRKALSPISELTIMPVAQGKHSRASYCCVSRNHLRQKDSNMYPEM